MNITKYSKLFIHIVRETSVTRTHKSAVLKDEWWFRFSILCHFWFSLDYFVLVLFAFVVWGLLSPVLRQEIGWEERR